MNSWLLKGYEVRITSRYQPIKDNIVAKIYM